MRHAACLAILFCFSGCAPATLDATTKETLAESMKSMTAGMTEDQKKAFAGDCTTLTMGAALKGGLLGKMMTKDAKAPGPDDLFKPLQGLTADQIHAKAEAFRADLKTNP